MRSVADIIEELGGVTALARALGHRWPTTVQGWKSRGVIPSRQVSAVLKAANTLGKPLSAADLFPAEDAAA